MKDPDQHHLASRALRGELTASEQAEFDRLMRDDSFRADWQLERALQQALAALPDAPVPSNFTSLVLQAARRPEALRPARLSLRFALAKFAGACALVAVLALAVAQQQQRAQRRELAQTVNAFHDVALVAAADQRPSTELFENFEAIERLSLPAESELDMELLLALQK